MIRQKIERIINKKRCTLLGIGPMSKNCVDASIEIANKYDVPVFLIASRRQIDSKEFGGGYVNNWDTKEFADYVNERDKKSNIILARDHGGPWQNDFEIKKGFSLKLAMDSAKKSFLEDIRAGFQKIHVDPSIDLYGGASVDDIIDRILDLYEFCWVQAQALGKDLVFEIGAEEQTGSASGTEEELDYLLTEVKKQCNESNLPLPTFVVVQTGTKVVETRNVGSLDSPFRIANEIAAEIQVPKMLGVCKRHKVFLKQHNTDYLSDETLKWLPKLGIHAANVAPEFGVAETQALFDEFEFWKRQDLLERYVEIAVKSKKWQKWVLESSKLSDKELALICGHYVYSNPEINEIKEEFNKSLPKNELNLDERLKIKVKSKILRYLTNFRLAGL